MSNSMAEKGVTMEQRQAGKPLFFWVLMVLGALLSSPSVMAEGGCPAGFEPDAANNFIVNGNFADSFNNWASNVPVGPDNEWPDDTSIAVMTGDFERGNAVQVAFPGDPGFDIPGESNWLYGNGNDTGEDILLAEQAVTGLGENTTYVFRGYYSNVIVATIDNPVDPELIFQAGDTVSEVLVVPDHLAVDGGVDVWKRFELPFTTAAGQTGLTVSITDVVRGSFGDDIAITALAIEMCVPIDGGGGEIAPAIGITPSEDTVFPETEINTSSEPQVFQIENTGDDDLVIGDITIDGINVDDFSINEDTCSGTTLAAGNTEGCTVSVIFSPAELGERGAELTIPSSDPDNASAVIALTGTAVEAVAVGPQLTQAPEGVIGFANTIVGVTSDPQVIQITNTGDADLVLGDAALDSAVFAISEDTCSGATLVVGDTDGCTISVTFTPDQLGEASADLSLPSNDPANDPLTINLTGAGIEVAPQLAISSEGEPVTSPVSFEPTILDETLSKTFVFSNTGDAPLTFTGIDLVATEYAIESNTCTEPEAVTLAEGGAETCEVTIAFTPVTLGNDKAGTLTMNAEGMEPVTLAMQGIGVVEAAGLIIIDDADIAANGLDFGVVPEGTSSDPIVIPLLNNTGDDIASIAASLSGGDFIVDDSACAAGLLSAASCDISVVFTPQSEGLQTETIILTTPTQTLEVAVEGTGSAAGVEDSDSDGLPDNIEDTNGNGIVDEGETDPQNADSDDDGLPDGVEDANKNGVFDAPDETDPRNPDTDGDTLLDGEEDQNADGVLGEPDASPQETDPRVADTDGDGADDNAEIAIGSDPRNADTDDDGEADGPEIGSDPEQPLDTDGDTLLDVFEPENIDTDQNGVNNENDADDDGDGLGTAEECGDNPPQCNDSDGNGIPDYLQAAEPELDSDDDGIPDEVEIAIGSNPFNQDTDGDGELDADEIGDNTDQPLDTDGDTLLDVFEPENIDTDQNGVNNEQDADDDGDGLGTAEECGDNPRQCRDSDSNGIPDYLQAAAPELDSDEDGIPDEVEIAIGSNPRNPDTDGDGELDADEIGGNTEQPLDSDGDTLLDVLEPENIDTDQDGVNNELDADDDGDGLGTAQECGDNPAQCKDSDSNGIPDYLQAAALEVDSDEDGIPDDVEIAIGSNPRNPDTDGDGELDADEIGDNIAQPLDSDGDTLLDVLEPENIDTDQNGVNNEQDADDDGDGLGTAQECGDNPAQCRDSDSNGIPDYLQAALLGVDSDSDGIHDDVEIAIGSDPRNPDTDGDGESDADEIGDNIDQPLDSDGDTLLDVLEPDNIDTDQDGLDNEHDADDDGDGQSTASECGDDPKNCTDDNRDGIPDYLQAANTNVAGETETVGPVLTQLEGGIGGGSLGWPLLSLLGAAAWMRRRKWAVMTASALSVGAFPANILAETGQWYLGLGVGQSTVEPDTTTNNTGYTVENDQDSGFKLFLGYDLSDNISIEGFYADLGAAELAPDGAIDYTSYGLEALLYLPNNTTNVAGYLKLGVGQIDNSSDSVPFDSVESTQLVGGLGVEARFANGFALRGEYEYYDEDAQLLSLNLLKRFGSKPAPQEKIVLAPIPPPPTPLDSDGDGVTDAQDRCPGTPAGVQVGLDGCRLDKDGDGVLNADDKCPDTAVGVQVDNRGCAVVDRFSGVLEGVHFETASDRLTLESKSILNGVAQELMAYPDVHVTIVGHTDDQGSAAFNKGLSTQRAKAVSRYLIEQGIEAARLRSTGRGEEEPIASNATAEGRALNRRVELLAEDNGFAQ